MWMAFIFHFVSIKTQKDRRRSGDLLNHFIYFQLNTLKNLAKGSTTSDRSAMASLRVSKSI